MANDRVTPFIHELCKMDRFGGRCVRKEFGIWEVYDINQWSEEQAVALHQRFPSISARVEANRRSLGGFSVRLQQHRASHVWVSLLVCAIMVSVLMSVTQFIKFQ